jgi:voltage-gated potassium channel
LETHEHNHDVKEKLRRIVFGTSTHAGRRFDVILLWVIILSILTVTLESVKSIGEKHHLLFEVLEWSFTIIFTLEYLVRIYISQKPFKYIFSYIGIIDMLAFMPTYLILLFPGGQYFIVLRGLRLLRMFRILKMIHYLKEIRTLLESIKNSIPKISIFLLFIIILVTILGSAMYVIEGSENGFKDIPNSIYWAIVTLATVGYGDITPITPLGKILASIIILIGYSIIAIPTSIITSEIIKEGRKQDKNESILKAPNRTKTCKECQHIQADPSAIFCSRCGTRLKSNI